MDPYQRAHINTLQRQERSLEDVTKALKKIAWTQEQLTKSVIEVGVIFKKWLDSEDVLPDRRIASIVTDPDGTRREIYEDIPTESVLSEKDKNGD